MQNETNAEQSPIPYFPAWMGETPRAMAPWTDAEREMVVAMYEARRNKHNLGLTEEKVQEIAKMVGRAKGGIVAHLAKALGIDHFLVVQAEDARAPRVRNQPFDLALAKAGYPFVYNGTSATLVAHADDIGMMVLRLGDRLRVCATDVAGLRMSPLMIDMLGNELYGGDECSAVVCHGEPNQGHSRLRLWLQSYGEGHRLVLGDLDSKHPVVRYSTLGCFKIFRDEADVPVVKAEASEGKGTTVFVNVMSSDVSASGMCASVFKDKQMSDRFADTRDRAEHRLLARSRELTLD